MGEVRLPPPDLQIGFAELLLQADRVFLQNALLATVAELPLRQIDTELHALVLGGSLERLAAAGLRGELLFPVPVVLSAKPNLLAYYRLLFGFSQKEFYLAKHGTSPFRSMEVEGVLSSRCAGRLSELCEAFAKCGSALLKGVAQPRWSGAFLDRLTLLTLGGQFRGSANVARGSAAIGIVFALIQRIAEGAIQNSSDTSIEVENAAGRKVIVSFAADPDIAITEEISRGEFTNKIAIEIKGGTDFSNIHNRVGEAEKSHQKARQRGFTEFWTIVNVAGFDQPTAARESPTTNRFYSLSDLQDGKSAACLDFTRRLRSLIGLRNKPGRK